MEKSMSEDVFMPQMPGATNPEAPKISGNIPPELAAMMRQNAQPQNQQAPNVPPHNLILYHKLQDIWHLQDL